MSTLILLYNTITFFSFEVYLNGEHSRFTHRTFCHEILSTTVNDCKSIAEEKHMFHAFFLHYCNGLFALQIKFITSAAFFVVFKQINIWTSLFKALSSSEDSEMTLQHAAVVSNEDDNNIAWPSGKLLVLFPGFELH